MLYLYHVNNLRYHEVVDQLTMGRTTGEIICADDGRMSGKHAQVSVETIENQLVLFVEDLGSKNKTIVNRNEIAPHQKIKIKMYCLLEVGDQKFVVTDSNNINVQNLNEMIEKHLRKSVIPLSAQAPPPIPKNPTVSKELTAFEKMQLKETKILQLHSEVTTLELNAKSELLRMEEAKEKLINNARAKKAELTKQMTTLKAEVDEAKLEMAKVKAELEQKKKKIINLKDIPSDEDSELPAESPEELPE